LEEGEMTEYVIRFLVGGIVVSAFAMLGNLLRPKSFAGLFGAAPSVALATLGIAIYQHGASYAAVQSRTMMAGAIALACRRVRSAGSRRRPGMSTAIRFSTGSLREGRWYEYVVRFALRPVSTVAVVIAFGNGVLVHQSSQSPALEGAVRRAVKCRRPVFA
jgi:hypothetical protein